MLKHITTLLLAGGFLISTPLFANAEPKADAPKNNKLHKKSMDTQVAQDDREVHRDDDASDVDKEGIASEE